MMVTHLSRKRGQGSWVRVLHSPILSRVASNGEPGVKEPGAKLPVRAHTLPGRLEVTKPEAGDPEVPFNGYGKEIVGRT